MLRAPPHPREEDAHKNGDRESLGALDPVSVVDVELDDPQRALSSLLQPVQRGGPRRVSRGRDDEVLRRLEEGLRELEPDPARAPVSKDHSTSVFRTWLGRG